MATLPTPNSLCISLAGIYRCYRPRMRDTGQGFQWGEDQSPRAKPRAPSMSAAHLDSNPRMRLHHRMECLCKVHPPPGPSPKGYPPHRPLGLLVISTTQKISIYKSKSLHKFKSPSPSQSPPPSPRIYFRTLPSTFAKLSVDTTCISAICSYTPAMKPRKILTMRPPPGPRQCK